MKTRRLPSNSRKLLIASVGIASVSYVVACSSGDAPSSGNLMLVDASTLDAPTSGNLMGGQPQDAALDAPTSGNLMAVDAGDQDASTDASDDAADGHG
jgi:hypothetical protein